MRASKSDRLLAAGVLVASLLLVFPSPQVAQQQRRSDPVEQFEKERRRRDAEAAGEKRRLESAAQAESRAALRQLREDLPKLRASLEVLEKKLAELDTETELSVDLRQQGKEVEELARRINKSLKRL